MCVFLFLFSVFLCVCVRFVYLVFVWFVVSLGFFLGVGGGSGEEVAMPRQPNTGVDKDTHSFYRSPKECQLVSVLTSSSKKEGLRM